jgi:hypothetical protein
MAQRYSQLIDIVREVKPKTIVEIGVHRGLRASLMCREALKFQEKIKYFGFDVFGTVDEAFHEEALNGKGMPSKDQAIERLKAIGPALQWGLIEGDTRKTLHHAGLSLGADLVFIDGDHRIEVIRGDYEPFKDARCVVLDDHYVTMVGGFCPVDTSLYGCNQLVEDLVQQGRKVEKLSVADRCNHGAYAQLVAVWK